MRTYFVPNPFHLISFPYCLSIFTRFPSIFKNPQQPIPLLPFRRKLSVIDNGFPLSARHKSVSKIRPSIDPSIVRIPSLRIPSSLKRRNEFCCETVNSIPFLLSFEREEGDVSSTTSPHATRNDDICVMISSIFSKLDFRAIGTQSVSLECGESSESMSSTATPRPC